MLGRPGVRRSRGQRDGVAVDSARPVPAPWAAFLLPPSVGAPRLFRGMQWIVCPPCRGTSAPTWSRPSSSSLGSSACGQKGPRGPGGLQQSEPEETVGGRAPPPPRGPQCVWGLRIHVPGEQQFGPEWFSLGWGEDEGRVSLHDLSAGTARTPGRGLVQALGPSKFSQIPVWVSLSSWVVLSGFLPTSPLTLHPRDTRAFAFFSLTFICCSPCTILVTFHILTHSPLTLSLYKRGTGGTERLSHLPKVTQPVRGGAGI